MRSVGKKPCVNCTCATTGFCPRGVGANVPAAETAAGPRATTPLPRNQSLREALRKLPQNRRRMRY